MRGVIWKKKAQGFDGAGQSRYPHCSTKNGLSHLGFPFRRRLALLAVQICSYYPPETAALLKKVAEKTRVPLAAYMREAADDLLTKYADTLQPPSPKSRKGG